METTDQPVVGAEIDGYRLVRQIGHGGFGTVWLSWSEASQSFHALKWVEGDEAALELELEALRKFREVSQKLRSPHLIAIEHIKRFPSGLIYTMPLADGMKGDDPSEESWQPMTLAAYIVERSSSWFSSAEILQIILPIIRATAALNGEGLVHRDIKPANILFFGGVSCLSDIGLLGDDSLTLTRRGTPGFLPPSWFLESSGQPDMWGLATTLYSLLTGNDPDKMGRPKFLWPPGGKASLNPSEQKQWERLHAVIFRATHEKAVERYLDFQTFADAVEDSEKSGSPKKRGILAFALVACVTMAALVGIFFLKDRQTRSSEPTNAGASPALSAPASEGIPVQEVAATPHQEFDDVIKEISKKLEKQKAEAPGQPPAFKNEVAGIIKKMNAYGSKQAAMSHSEGMFIPPQPGLVSGSSAVPKTEESAQTNGGETTLLEIRDDLQSLVKKLPATTFYEEMEAANRLYESLVDAAYDKAATADEKFYFNENIRPRLEEEFQRIFQWKPGPLPFDSTGINMEMALMPLERSPDSETVMQEVRSAISEIRKRLEPPSNTRGTRR